MNYTLELLARIYGEHGYIELAPNADGLENLWDLRYVENKKEFARFTINWEQASKLAEALKIIVKVGNEKE
jgi:hypothetical protein